MKASTAFGRRRERSNKSTSVVAAAPARDDRRMLRVLEDRRSLIASLLALAALPSAAVSWAQDQTPPVLGTPTKVIERMFWLARLRSTDTLIDLGSGDGRIVIEAAQRYGARGIGVEMRADLVAASRKEAEKFGLDSRVSFRAEDIFHTDLSEATVLTLYLSAEFNERLMPRILQTMRPGARVVSHDFAMGTWRPDQAERFDVPEKNHGRGGESSVMLWIVPANAAGRWRGMLGEGSMQRDIEFSIVQQFQTIEGALRTDRGHRRFTRATLRAEELTFSITDAPSPYAKGTVRVRIEGDRMSGIFRFDDTSAVGTPFRAQRVSARPELFD